MEICYTFEQILIYLQQYFYLQHVPCGPRMKHSFKNHKDAGYTKERQVLQNFEKWFSFTPIFNRQIYIDII